MQGCSRRSFQSPCTAQSFTTHYAPTDLDCSGPEEAYQLGRASVSGGPVPRGGRPSAEVIASWSRGVTDGLDAARTALTEQRAHYLVATMARPFVPSNRSELPTNFGDSDGYGDIDGYGENEGYGNGRSLEFFATGARR